MIPILQKDNSLLRQHAAPVPVSTIGSKKLNETIARMKQVLVDEEDAVAVAAPQIGESIRLFVVSGKILMPSYPEIEVGARIPKDLVCINPELTNLSKKKEKMLEGCLSVRWLYGKTPRSTKATIRAYDENGKIFTRGGSGLLAQIFQHEMDHLEGVLFIDTASDIENIPPKRIEEEMMPKQKSAVKKV